MNREMFKLIVLLTILSCLFISSSSKAENLKNLEGHKFELRPRLGHFKNAPFTDLYKIYAAAFVKPNHPERSNDDFRNYLPDSVDCINFFRQFRIDKHQLRDIDQLVVLDACLGYLFESEFQQLDMEENKMVAKALPDLIKDQTLIDLYKNTKIDEFPEEAKACIGDLLVNFMLAKKQFDSLVCDNHRLEIFNEFAECRAWIPKSAQDSYADTLNALVRERGKECFELEVQALNENINKVYAKNTVDRISNHLSFSRAKKQAKEREWPKEIVRVLSAVQGTDQEINLRKVHEIIKGVDDSKPELEGKLLENMERFANKNIDRSKKADLKDPTGSSRYERLVDDMCNFFRRGDHQNGQYDFATPYVRMIKMLKYQDVYGIKQRDFVKRVLLHGVSAPLYLCVSACNLLTFTEAVFRKSLKVNVREYQVVFKADTSEMVQWPNADFY